MLINSSLVMSRSTVRFRSLAPISGWNYQELTFLNVLPQNLFSGTFSPGAPAFSEFLMKNSKLTMRENYLRAARRRNPQWIQLDSGLSAGFRKTRGENSVSLRESSDIPREYFMAMVEVVKEYGHP